VPITITDVDQGRGNLIRGEGQIHGEEYVRVMRQHLTKPASQFKKYRYSLFELTAVSAVDVPAKDVHVVARLCRDAAHVNPDAVVAIVVGENDLAFGLSRMWQLSLGDAAWEVQVFRDTDDALAWITDRAAEKFGLTELTFA